MSFLKWESPVRCNSRPFNECMRVSVHRLSALLCFRCNAIQVACQLEWNNRGTKSKKSCPFIVGSLTTAVFCHCPANICYSLSSAIPTSVPSLSIYNLPTPTLACQDFSIISSTPCSSLPSVNECTIVQWVPAR